MIYRLGVTLVSLVLMAACSNTKGQSDISATELSKEPAAVVYLTRHAEKLASGKDPKLSEKGQQRAQALALTLADVELDRIYSTDYQRTQMTAQPTAASKEVEVISYNLPIKLLAAKILKLHNKDKVLVVGHSNTTPELIAALGIETPIVIEHHQYGDLFIIEFFDGKPQLSMSKFGESMPEHR